MRKIILFTLPIIILFTACGEPTPKEQELAKLKAKLEATHGHRFQKTNAHTYKIQTDNLSPYTFNNKSLSFKKATKWKEIGVDKTEYKFWANLHVEPSEAQKWKKVDISLAAVAVFKKINYSPNKAKKYLKKSFVSRPKFYHQYGTPVYEFDAICESIVEVQKPPFAFLDDQCVPYMAEAHKNEVMGHLLDKSDTKKGPLAIEYIANLRHLSDNIKKIQSGMEFTIEEFIEDEDEKNFVFLFPLLQNEPLQQEMSFIDTYNLALTDDERFFSFNNKEYWLRRKQAEEAAIKAAAMQEALLKAKKESEKKAALLRFQRAEALSKNKAEAEEKYRKETLKKKRYAAIKEEQLKQKKLKESRYLAKLERAKSSCGKLIEAGQVSAQKVFIAGKVIFKVENAGDRMFGYGVLNAYDKHIYFVRDPKNIAKKNIKENVIWNLKTVGRTEALSSISDDKFVYDKKSKTKFTMALLLQECKVN